MVLDTLPETFERHIARLLVVLHYCGESVSSLIAGETRQVDSLPRLGQFDFWVREPGHLALALLHAWDSAPGKLEAQRQTLAEAIRRMLADDQADTRRVVLPGTSYSFLDDFDYNLAFLTSRLLVSDRPTFAGGRVSSHQIVLETPGIELVQRIFAECPSFGWYRTQSEIVAAFFPLLAQIDLAAMPYLRPDVTPTQAAYMPLVPTIRRRFLSVFGDS